MRTKLSAAGLMISTVVFWTAPAFAQETLDPRVEHEAKEKWFFWPNFAFAVGALGLAALLGFIYFIKIVRPRMRRAAR